MSPIYLSKVVCVHYLNLSFTIESESNFDTAAVCINEERDRKRHPSDIYPSSCLSACLWHCEMEKKASSKMRCKHVNSMNSCFAMELFERWTYMFLSAFTVYVVRLTETHFFPPHFLSLPAFFPFFSLYSEPSGFHSRKKSAVFVKYTASSGQGLEWLFVKLSQTGESQWLPDPQKTLSSTLYPMWCENL